MPRFTDIPPLTRTPSYMVHIGLDYLARHYTRYVTEYGLDVNPDFQRGYVWTERQKIRFMEYMLRGGSSGLDIYTNCPNWNSGRLDPYNQESWFVLVDGKQRLDAALGFLNNEFPVFGAYYREYTDKPRIVQSNFRWHVNDLKTREECLQWYLDLNSGGTVHSEDELEKVRQLIRDGGPYVRPSHEVIFQHAAIDRPICQEVIREKAEEDAEREQKAKEQAALEAQKPKKRGRPRKG